jgi:hypothetical protein
MRSSWFACYLCCLLYWVYSLRILTFTHAHANYISHISTRPWFKRSRAFDFNQDIGSWNVSSVTDMGSMFTWVLRDYLEMRSSWFVCFFAAFILIIILASHSNIHKRTHKPHLAHLLLALNSTQLRVWLQPGYWELGCLQCHWHESYVLVSIERCFGDEVFVGFVCYLCGILY